MFDSTLQQCWLNPIQELPNQIYCKADSADRDIAGISNFYIPDSNSNFTAGRMKDVQN